MTLNDEKRRAVGTIAFELTFTAPFYTHIALGGGVRGHFFILDADSKRFNLGSVQVGHGSNGDDKIKMSFSIESIQILKNHLTEYVLLSLLTLGG